jgi:glycosyltransferase involved in cell wall biosynthesis
MTRAGPEGSAPGVVHLATSPGDGAGTAALRQHEALLGAGLPSRMLCAHVAPGRTVRHGATCQVPRGTFRERLARRLLGQRDPQALAERGIASALRRSQGGDTFEIFSTPYSRFTPESHPWVAEAGIVHLHWVSSFVDYPRFFAACAKPRVWTLHDQAPYLGGFHYEADRATAPGLAALDDEFKAVKRRALAAGRRPLAVVGNSLWNTRRARASGFFPPGAAFETIYYPLDTRVFSPRDKASAKEALGIPPGEFTVGFASTSLDNPRKGLGDLMRAFALLDPKAAPRPVGLLSFGRDPDPTAREGVRAPWHQFGFVEDDAHKATLYSAMDCFVIPSHAEAFGQTAIEAMACATAVIGSRVDGIVEALDEGRAGILFPAGDSAAIAAAVDRLMRSPAEATALGAAGRRHVVGRHEPGKCAAAYAALYREIAGTQGAPAL